MKKLQRIEPSGGGTGLFGWHTIPPEERRLIITEGEFDAMAVGPAAPFESRSNNSLSMLDLFC